MALDERQQDHVGRLWGATHVQFLRYSENRIYAFEHARGPAILRITSPAHRRAAEIEAELRWMAYLQQHGLCVAEPLPSRAKRLVEVLDGGDVVCAFTRVPGGGIRHPNQCTPALLFRLGQLIGTLHRLTKSYHVDPPAPTRSHWYDDVIFRRACDICHHAAPPIQEALQRYRRYLTALPQSTDGYGLIHADIIPGNFHVDGDTLWLFDFDDSCYQWFAYDVAVSLLSLGELFATHHIAFDQERVLATLLEGYAVEHVLPAKWIDRIGPFMNYRLLLLTLWCLYQLQSRPQSNRASAVQSYGEWCASRIDHNLELS